VALHDETVTIVRRTTTGVDADGVPTYSETEQVLESCNVQPLGGEGDTDEVPASTEPIVSRWRVSTDEPEDWIEASDAVKWRGRRYEVMNQRPRTFWAINPHTEFVMIETEG